MYQSSTRPGNGIPWANAGQMTFEIAEMLLGAPSCATATALMGIFRKGQGGKMAAGRGSGSPLLPSDGRHYSAVTGGVSFSFQTNSAKLQSRPQLQSSLISSTRTSPRALLEYAILGFG